MTKPIQDESPAFIEHMELCFERIQHGAIKGPGTLFHERDFVALYSTLPIYYPNEMWTRRSENVELVLCWLLPITEAEWRVSRTKRLV
jgi:hypothetical protein